MKIFHSLLWLFLGLSLQSQTTINFQEDRDNKLYIKLYGHIDYNQKIEKGKRHLGKMDVHRLVTLFGYQFNRKTQFVSEIEVEHVKEIFIEQAFIKHRLSRGINLRAGLLIVPMGLVNISHEPTFFYSVERPLLDKNIIPSTWREIGFGISGLIKPKSLRYQLYLLNNPISFDGSGRINAEKGIRPGRQKGAESIVSSFPGISGQVEYFGINGAKMGLSVYHGKTNTSLINDYPESTEANNLLIDSSQVRLSMGTLHSTLDLANLTFRFQYTIAGFSNASNYNTYTGSDVPELMHGYYILVAYDFLKNQNLSLSPFIRYSHLNNHLSIPDNIVRDPSLSKDIFTIGINYKPNPGVVFKADYQFYRSNGNDDFQQFNTGVGVWF